MAQRREDRKRSTRILTGGNRGNRVLMISVCSVASCSKYLFVCLVLCALAPLREFFFLIGRHYRYEDESIYSRLSLLGVWFAFNSAQCREVHAAFFQEDAALRSVL